MAFPVILVNFGTGSDTVASGAGPATALTGTVGISASDGLSIILDALTDLSGVATDGSHVIYFADSNAGSRNFAKITGTSGSGGATPTVTISDAVRASQTKSWAIGGKRATLDNANTRKLGENNSAAGDAMPGWTIQYEDAQTLNTSAFVLHRGGDTTSGYITIQGNSATSRPIVTQTANAACFELTVSVTNIKFKDLHCKNSNGTKTGAYGISTTGNSPSFITVNCILGDSTNKLQYGINAANAGTTAICIDTAVINCNSVGIFMSVNTTLHSINSRVQNCTGNGIQADQGGVPSLYLDNMLITGNGGRGILLGPNTTLYRLVDSTIHGNTQSGLELSGGNGVHNELMSIHDNNFTGNGGYGVNWSGTPKAYALIDSNNYGTGATANTSGARSNFITGDNDLAVDPQYTDASNGDFSVGTNLKAKGHPVGGSIPVGAGGSTYSYMDIGVAQRQESGGGGTTIIVPAINITRYLEEG